jgi:hypothetical protein
MYCRSALFIGTVDPDNIDEFKSQLEGNVAEAILKFPGIINLEMKWAKEIDDGGPSLLLIIEHSYASKSDLEKALASDARAGSLEALKPVMPYFKGDVFHVNSDVKKFNCR